MTVTEAASPAPAGLAAHADEPAAPNTSPPTPLATEAAALTDSRFTAIVDDTAGTISVCLAGDEFSVLAVLSLEDDTDAWNAVCYRPGTTRRIDAPFTIELGEPGAAIAEAVSQLEAIHEHTLRRLTATPPTPAESAVTGTSSAA